jgi:hypothetical protein
MTAVDNKLLRVFEPSIYCLQTKELILHIIGCEFAFNSMHMKMF